MGTDIRASTERGVGTSVRGEDSLADFRCHHLRYRIGGDHGRRRVVVGEWRSPEEGGFFVRGLSECFALLFCLHLSPFLVIFFIVFFVAPQFFSRLFFSPLNKNKFLLSLSHLSQFFSLSLSLSPPLSLPPLSFFPLSSIQWGLKRTPTADGLVCGFGLMCAVPFLAMALAVCYYSGVATWVLIFIGEVIGERERVFVLKG